MTRRQERQTELPKFSIPHMATGKFIPTKTKAGTYLEVVTMPRKNSKYQTHPSSLSIFVNQHLVDQECL